MSEVDLLPATVDKNEDNMVFDEGNMAVFDTNPIDAGVFKQDPEDYLSELSRDNVQLLMNRIFSLPTEKSFNNVGRLAVLPEPSTRIPREKPVPKPKQMTTWEKFAKMKGIQKKKKSQKVWDEEKQEWRRAYGYKKANDKADTWLIPHKAGDDPTIDPWTRMDNEKKARVNKNKGQQLKNMAGGKSKRVVASLAAAPGKRLDGAIDLSTAIRPTALKRNQVMSEKKLKTQHHVDVALALSQKSTASMGKFDSKRYNEPVRKQHKAPRRDAELQHHATEKTQSMGVFNKMFLDKTDRYDIEKAANLHKAFSETSGAGGADTSNKKRKRR